MAQLFRDEFLARMFIESLIESVTVQEHVGSVVEKHRETVCDASTKAKPKERNHNRILDEVIALGVIKRRQRRAHAPRNDHAQRADATDSNKGDDAQ